MAYGNGGTAAASAAIQKGNSIPEFLNQQGAALDGAHSLVTELAKRLESVLTPLPAAPSGNSPDAPMPPQITARLDKHTRGIHQLCSRIQDLIDRLEL